MVNRNGSRSSPVGLPKTLGPVESLEAHVAPEWWRQIFNGIYLKTDGDVVMDDEITSQEVDLIQEYLALRPDDRILDLCCGHGRHTLELAGQGFSHVEGLDRSRALIRRARRSARSKDLNVRFREGDARKLRYADGSLDVVLLLGNSFGYFETVEEDLRVLREIGRVLAPGGRVLIDVTDGEYVRQTFEPRSWEWLDRQTFVCRERSISADQTRLITRELVTHAQEGILVDQFYAERLYARTELLDLLDRAGFEPAIVHAEVNTNSRRDQDLGMMSRRLMISARTAKPVIVGHDGERSGTQQVAVIMGDPGIPDPVKPAAVFDDDDFDTIGRLQSALGKLNGYQFSYLSDHSTLLEDLRALTEDKPLVFNLCDEGLSNKARWELHVPAMLEAIGLPYTGAAPQSLALCYDKSVVRSVAMEMGIPTPEAAFIGPDDRSIENPPSFPVIIKPNFGDSSVGITQNSVVHSPEELLTALSQLRGQLGYGTAFVIETFLPGKDLSVGIIGNPDDAYQILPVIEEDYSQLPPELPRICGYEAKWLPESPYWNLRSIPADLPAHTANDLRESCLRLFDRLECRDYARFDWRLDAQGTPRLLEVNPNPGWCWDGHLAKMATLAGMSYAEMLEAILRAAQRRLRLPNNDLTE